MSSILFLAGRYLLHHRLQTLVLVLSLAGVFALPASLLLLARQAQEQLTRRAEGPALLLGARGSPLELTLNALYFRTRVPDRVRFEEVQAVRDSGLATPVPLYCRFRCQDDPIVATSLDYFSLRRLRVQAGRQMTRLGDCVVGAEVARRRNLKPGDRLLSSPERAFEIAGVQPLKLRVTGVLAFADGPDDRAVFVDLKTAWIIEGLGHGHQDLAPPASEPGGHVTARAPLPSFTEVTDANVDSFHFHGEVGQFPITAILAVPADEKSATRLLGRYQAEGQALQAVEPRKVMGELLGTVLTFQAVALAGFALVGVVTLGLMALIQSLSIRLRRAELETLHRIGAARGRVLLILSAEALLVLTLGLLLAGGVALGVDGLGPDIVRWWVTR